MRQQVQSYDEITGSKVQPIARCGELNGKLPVFRI